MSKTAAANAERIAALAAVAVVAHYLVGLDWPWAVVAGAVVALLARAVFHRRPAARL